LGRANLASAAAQNPDAVASVPNRGPAFAFGALLTLFVSFNDTFFMALMFFVSGLFVWSSLIRKGNASFLRDRFKRLGIPFLFAAAIVAPLAYYRSYLMAGGRGVADYVHDWLSFGDWPTGPAWFIWLLLAFDLVVGAIFAFAPGFGTALSRLAENAREHPARFFCDVGCGFDGGLRATGCSVRTTCMDQHRTVSV
jgi:Acyltransferase family